MTRDEIDLLAYKWSNEYGEDALSYVKDSEDEFLRVLIAAWNKANTELETYMRSEAERHGVDFEQ